MIAPMRGAAEQTPARQGRPRSRAASVPDVVFGEAERVVADAILTRVQKEFGYLRPMRDFRIMAGHPGNRASVRTCSTIETPAKPTGVSVLQHFAM
jgi:hypothetical protein